MTVVPEITIEAVAACTGDGSRSLHELAAEAARGVFDSAPFTPADIGGVVAATFTNPDRFPSLSARIAHGLGLGPVPALDLQMACSAYPYALYVAGRLAADTGRKILVVDGDVQTPFVDKADHATGGIFSDAATATVVSCGKSTAATSEFDFYTRFDEALTCGAAGPIKMDGFKVFSFVATEVSKWLKPLVEFAKNGEEPIAAFVPHNANPYMVRQLAKSLGLSGRLVTADDALLNTGSSSIPLALATKAVPAGKVLLAAFGAGLSASACIVRHSPRKI